jgi:hypothetical protein
LKKKKQSTGCCNKNSWNKEKERTGEEDWKGFKLASTSLCCPLYLIFSGKQIYNLYFHRMESTSSTGASTAPKKGRAVISSSIKNKIKRTEIYAKEKKIKKKEKKKAQAKRQREHEALGDEVGLKN